MERAIRDIRQRRDDIGIALGRRGSDGCTFIFSHHVHRPPFAFARRTLASSERRTLRQIKSRPAFWRRAACDVRREHNSSQLFDVPALACLPAMASRWGHPTLTQINDMPGHIDSIDGSRGRPSMQLRNSANGYGAVSRFLHWITVILC